MSVKRWRQQEKENAELEEQEQEIRQEFKMNKIKKEFGQISGEELFKPITKRLDKAAKEPEPAEELAPDYEMDEFDRLNPFDGEFRPDAETPPPSSSPPPSPAEEEESDDEGGDEVQETTTRKAWEAPVKPKPEMHESTELGTIRSLLTKYGDDPNYRVKSKTSKFQGYSVEDLKKREEGILRRRGELPQPAHSGLDDASWEGETEGSSLGEPDADKLINQLYVRLGSIKAGNTSTKLRKQAVDLIQLLYKRGIINDFEKKNIFHKFLSP